LCALPDDVLRAVATFLPTSGLIVLAQSSRAMAVVLQDKLTLRLDNLFIVTQSEYEFVKSFHIELLTYPLRCEIEALFGEASVDSEGWSSYFFVEASKGYNGPRIRLRFYLRCPEFAWCRYGNAGSRYDGRKRFATWLQRQLERLRAAKALGDASAASVPSPT
jgi:hypothetical protein